jgi:hypothetical protein
MRVQASSDGNQEAARNRRCEFWVGVGMLVCGLLVVFGAWREVTHHDGLLLVVAPASMMPMLSALLARRAAREKRGRQ